MEVLPIEYKKYGYTYKQVIREGDVAIYSQFVENKTEPLAYNVFIVQKQQASTIYNRQYPAKETPPGNSLWGIYGYTCQTLERALFRLNQFKERINSKQLQSGVVEDNEDAFGGLNF